ncbi:hypothetical protein ROJ8625_04019 [Roseivivax jejudonensis]|uniref:Uncharacterized protein n=1 Tax=Roseivivax jejudonensis TaxID=1529041 RepID=A0A1X7AA83_9RHOB|nr:hypothetical protein [Roseivivax jejudonensis]SLN74171.1 hypothetical protein ROJ8625_04019 [Roseivivax jejudonensis]
MVAFAVAKACRAAVLGALLAVVPAVGMAAQAKTTRIVISDDRGGLVHTRAQDVARIRARGQTVAISGRVCLSSCTMYLGAGDVCVRPDVTFGFHGPSYYGRRLSQHDFDYWSAVISSHYPPALRKWYMQKARFRLRGFYRISGRQLIAMGVPEC